MQCVAHVRQQLGWTKYLSARPMLQARGSHLVFPPSLRSCWVAQMGTLRARQPLCCRLLDPTYEQLTLGCQLQALLAAWPPEVTTLGVLRASAQSSADMHATAAAVGWPSWGLPDLLTPSLTSRMQARPLQRLLCGESMCQVFRLSLALDCML